MQSERERRIREVWETTQENLETAVGTAYSRWTVVNNQYVNPTVESISGCMNGCFGSCFSSQRHNTTNRRNSMDFFDMYDEEGEFGRDELERLLNDDQIEDYDDLEDGDGMSYERQVNNGEGGSAGPPAITNVLRDTKRSFMSVVGSFLPLWAKPNALKYKPSTAGLTGFRPANRSRSSTKSSIQSSETFRSRTDLFSDEEYEDAQMVSDNFAASLVFGSGRNRASTVGSRTSVNSGKASAEASADNKSIDSKNSSSSKKATTSAVVAPTPATTVADEASISSKSQTLSVEPEGASEEVLREEELQAEREEELEIERRRKAAQVLASDKGLTVSIPQHGEVLPVTDNVSSAEL